MGSALVHGVLGLLRVVCIFPSLILIQDARNFLDSSRHLIPKFLSATNFTAMALDGMDTESLALIIQLQVSDVKSLDKGKGSEGKTSDKETALSTYKSELESLAASQSDRVLCQSIARAVQLDGDAIGSHMRIEQQAASDRHQALGTNPGAAGRANVVAAGQDALDDDVIRQLGAMNVYDDEGTVAESSSWAASRPRASDSLDASTSCIACGDAVLSGEFFQGICSHSYCRECLGALFTASFTDESLFPPRCCKLNIPIELTKQHLPPDLVMEYHAKKIEYGTPNRTYCHEATCSTFIPPASIEGDTATCPGCGNGTCVLCKGQSHKHECPADTATQEVLRIASQNGWQRCRSCRRMVELETGCNHICKAPTPSILQLKRAF